MIPGPDGIDPAAVDSLDAAASHLYGLAADDFVAARDHLARGLRAAGRKDLAATVKTLRRPTAVAAELNRALRADPAARDALLAAAEALRAGHHRLLSGGHADLAQLQGAHRAAAADLAGHAGAHRESVAAALEAASLDTDLHDQLRAATFAQEPQPARGFDLLSAGLAMAGAVERDRPRPARSAPPRSTPTPARSRRPVSGEPVDDGPDADHGPAERPASRHPDDAPTGPAPDTGGVDEPTGPTAADLARAEQEAAARKTAITERANAERRLEAARAGELRAAAKVAELEQRLAEARAHLHDTETRTAAAASALERADLRLRQLGTHPRQL